MTLRGSLVVWCLAVVGCTAREGAQEPPARPKPAPRSEGITPLRRPLELSGLPGPVTGPLAPWASFPALPVGPADESGAAVALNTRRCGELAAPGTVLHVGSTVEVFRSDVESLGLSLAFLSPDDLRELGRTRSIGAWGDYSAIAALGPKGALLADLAGQLHAFVAGQTRVLATPLPTTKAGDIDRIWVSGDTILVARSRDSRGGVWEVLSTKGGASTPIATGGVHRCGQPLVGKRALAVAGRRLVLLDLAARLVPEVVAESPLDRNLCAAGDGLLLAVTGWLADTPTLAVHDADGWHLFPLPPSGEIFEPYVRAGSVVVTAPGAPVRTPEGGVVPEAGAVYVFANTNGRWISSDRLVSTAPGPRGLFGFAMAMSDDALYVSEMVPGIVRNTEGGITSLGRPSTCRIPRVP